MNDITIDYSEVAGKKVTCPDTCGLCCLCQPEVLPEERNFFRSNHPNALVKARYPDEHFALAMKKGKGSCVFLENRKCSVYANRPTYCRQFPFHFHVSDRIKVELDLSCRGAWQGSGIDAASEAKALADRSAGRLRTALREASVVYSDFFSNCREAGVYAERSELRNSVTDNLNSFTDLAYIAKVMNMSLEEPSVSLADVIPDEKIDMDELNVAAREAAMDSLRSSDPLNVPVYCDGKWNWNLFMAKKKEIEWFVLDDAGDMKIKGSVDIDGISLPQLDAGARNVLKDYVSVLNQRDSMMGFAFHTMDSLDYEDDMTNVYYGTLTVAVVDLMWRSALLDRLIGTGTGENGMREAIIFYDMDRLDAPTIGAFV